MSKNRPKPGKMNSIDDIVAELTAKLTGRPAKLFARLMMLMHEVAEGNRTHTEKLHEEIEKLEADLAEANAKLAFLTPTNAPDDRLVGEVITNERIRNALRRYGNIHTVGELCNHTASQVGDITNIADKSVAAIEAMLQDAGLSLKSEP